MDLNTLCDFVVYKMKRWLGLENMYSYSYSTLLSLLNYALSYRYTSAACKGRVLSMLYIFLLACNLLGPVFPHLSFPAAEKRQKRQMHAPVLFCPALQLLMRCWDRRHCRSSGREADAA